MRISQIEQLRTELLVVRCQLGERFAFDELVRCWASPLRRHVLRIAGRADLVDDLVQDIWLRILRGIAGLREPAHFRAWLFGIAHRALMDRLRDHYAAQRTVDALAELPPPDSEESMRLEASHVAIDAALGRLPMVEREVLTLFYLEDLSIADIARALDRPEGTIKSRLFRARALLRDVLNHKESSNV